MVDIHGDDSSHLRDVRESLWLELTVPAATQSADASDESRIFWRCMQRHEPALARRVGEFCAERQRDDARKKELRAAYRDACNAVFRPEMEMLVVRPLVIALAHPEYPVDSAEGSRYSSLFQGHGV